MNTYHAFGAIDNLILVGSMIFMATVGHKAQKSASRLFSWMSPVMGAIMGGFFGNAFSDAIAAIPMGWTATHSVFVGCLLPFVLFLIPPVWKAIQSA